jgi:hypothetical protein
MADNDSPSLEGLIGSRARDDNGRFVSVTPTEEPKEPVKAPEPAKAAPEPAKASEPVVTPTPATAPVVAQPTQPTENAETAAYKKAMREEREKRQAAEARLRELQTPKTPVDPWQDLSGTLTQQEQKFEERLFVERCNTTEELARDRHKDFDEVREVFLEAAQNNPTLFQQLRQERNPAEFAYREGLRIKELKDVNGDFSAYKSKLEKDIEARLTAQFEAKYGKQPEVPTSLNSDTSPAQQTAVYAGPPKLETILRSADKANARR